MDSISYSLSANDVYKIARPLNKLLIDQKISTHVDEIEQKIRHEFERKKIGLSTKKLTKEEKVLERLEEDKDDLVFRAKVLLELISKSEPVKLTTDLQEDIRLLKYALNKKLLSQIKLINSSKKQISNMEKSIAAQEEFIKLISEQNKLLGKTLKEQQSNPRTDIKYESTREHTIKLNESNRQLISDKATLLHFENEFEHLNSSLMNLKALEDSKTGLDKVKSEIKTQEEDVLKELRKVQKEMDKELVKKIERTETKNPSERINKANKDLREHYSATNKVNRAIRFDTIRKYDSLDALMLGDDGRIDPMLLIIYRSTDNYGHWCGLVFNDEKNVTFFNPYGSFIDKSIDNIPEKFRESSNQNYPHLLALLEKSSYTVHYNDVQLQTDGDGINTCGRWTGMFLQQCANKPGIEKGKSIVEFVKPFKKIEPEMRDEIITSMTNVYLDGESSRTTIML